MCWLQIGHLGGISAVFRVVALMLVTLLIPGLTCAGGDDDRDTQRTFTILIFGPKEEASAPATKLFIKGMESRLKQSGKSFRIKQENLKLQSSLNENEKKQLAGAIRKKYEQDHIDLIVTRFPAPTDFAFTYRELLFPTVPIMDVQMPLMDGLTTTAIIRNLENGLSLPQDLPEDLVGRLRVNLGSGHLPIVAMTAHAMGG